MICRTCLRRAAGLVQRTQRTQPSPYSTRAFTTGIPFRSGSSAPAPSQATSESTPSTTGSGDGSTPSEAGEEAKLSSCPPGTILSGLNYFKGKPDLVAKADEEYPAWLWKCLDSKKEATEEADENAGDEFSKSRKQRRLAAKRQRKIEAQILATGDIEALAPKIPLQQQTINLPGGEDKWLESAIVAANKREELRRAMRKERRAKIKENNYLKSM